MNDIISVNRLFLIMARDQAKSKSGEVITGLSRPVLDQLADLSVDQIDELARTAGISLISLISFRLTETELGRLLISNQKSSYSFSLMASRE